MANPGHVSAKLIWFGQAHNTVYTRAIHSCRTPFKGHFGDKYFANQKQLIEFDWTQIVIYIGVIKALFIYSPYTFIQLGQLFRLDGPK